MAVISGAQEPKFLDRLFAPFRGRVSAEQTEGVGGTAVFGGYVSEREQNPNLVGLGRYKTYGDMLSNVSIVSAGTRYFLNLVAKSSWKVEPAKDNLQMQPANPELEGSQPRRTATSTPDAIELAEVIAAMMDDMETTWARVVRRAAMYRFYGFSVQEWTAKPVTEERLVLQPGMIGMLDIEPRPQVTIERWDLDRTGKVHGVVQRSPQNSAEIYLPREKLIYMCDDALSDSPEGLGLFRHLVESSQRLQRFQLLEAYGYETDLRGIPVGRAPMAALAELEQQGKIASASDATTTLRNFIVNHIKNPKLGLLLDSATYRNLDEAASPSNVKQWDLELLKGDNANSSEAVALAIERLNVEMARIMGVEGLLLGAGTNGSQALSRDKSHNFALIVDSTLDELAETMQKDFVEVIFDLNGWDKRKMPTVKTEATRYRDVEQITGALDDMSRAGAMLSPDDPAILEVRDLLGLSHPSPDSMILDASLMRDAVVRGARGPEDPNGPGAEPKEPDQV